MFNSIGEKLFSFNKKQAFNLNNDNTSNYQRAWAELAAFYKLSDLLPYEAFDSANALFHNQNSIGFVIETAPLVGASESMQKEISNLFAISLPEQSSAQVMLFADPDTSYFLNAYKNLRDNTNSPTLKIMADKRANYLNEFSLNSPLKPYNLRNFRCFISISLKKPSNNQFLKINETCLSIKNQVLTTLEMIGAPAYVWQPSDLIATFENIFKALEPKALNNQNLKTKYNPLEKLSNQVIPSNCVLKLDKDNLVLNEDVCIKTFSVKSYPSVWSLHAMGQLIGDNLRDQAQIPCPFMIHYGVYIPKQESPKNKLLAKASYVEKQAYSPIGKYLPSITDEAIELAYVRENLNKGERIVNTHFGISLFSPKEGIDNATSILNNLFITKEWKLEENKYLHLPMFLSSLPLMWSEPQVHSLLNLAKLKTTLSTESANLLPLQGEWKGTSTASMLLAGRCGQIFSFCPFDNNAGNYNMCVVGRSGSGKSVFMQELMTSTLGIGGRVFVLDVGRSFEKTCFLLEGQFIEFSPNTKLCLNPFSTIPTTSEEIASDALAMLKSVLMLMASPSGNLDDKAISLLEQGMLETWNKYKNEATITDIANFLNNHSDARANDLGQMLFAYTKDGTYGRFFNSKSNVNLNSSLIVIELEELKERKDLQAVIVQMMIINITNDMFLGDRKTPFNIVFDEAWDMLRGSQSALFIETLARRLRKYYGSLVVGTQSVNDFYQSAGARAAFDNSDWMCFLSQKPESIDQLKKSQKINLSSQQEQQLKSLRTKQGEYAEVMISGSSGYAIGRLLLDPFSNLLYSTKASDYANVKALTNSGMSLTQAIEYLIEHNNTTTINQSHKIAC